MEQHLFRSKAKAFEEQMLMNLFQKGTNVPKFVPDKFLKFVPKMGQILKICSQRAHRLKTLFFNFFNYIKNCGLLLKFYITVAGYSSCPSSKDFIFMLGELL